MPTAPSVTQVTASVPGHIELLSVSKRYGSAPDTPLALADIDLDIKPGEFVSIVGRSGCGKTTLLRIIAGLVSATEGRIELNGEAITGPGPDRGVVFQQGALFPWLTVTRNVTFGLRELSWSKADAAERALDLLKVMGLEQAADKYPRELSGGMAQRVAIARALAPRPAMLLMDEPFGALDELTREQLQDELLRIWELSGKTVVFVTHSIEEAVYLSDRVVVLAPGPGHVTEILDIDVPRPRQRSGSKVVELHREIHRAIF